MAAGGREDADAAAEADLLSVCREVERDTHAENLLEREEGVLLGEANAVAGGAALSDVLVHLLEELFGRLVAIVGVTGARRAVHGHDRWPIDVRPLFT